NCWWVDGTRAVKDPPAPGATRLQPPRGSLHMSQRSQSVMQHSNSRQVAPRVRPGASAHRSKLRVLGPSLLGLLGAGLVSAACGGPQAPQTGGLAGDTAIGKNRCADAATSQLRPFIVEWDATDLASFESKASRDIIFVKYEGCDLTVLEGCSDAGIPGKYGRYQPPVSTGGTLEGLGTKPGDEPSAKRPL